MIVCTRFWWSRWNRIPTGRYCKKENLDYSLSLFQKRLHLLILVYELLKRTASCAQKPFALRKTLSSKEIFKVDILRYISPLSQLIALWIQMKLTSSSSTTFQSNFLHQTKQRKQSEKALQVCAFQWMPTRMMAMVVHAIQRRRN